MMTHKFDKKGYKQTTQNLLDTNKTDYPFKNNTIHTPWFLNSHVVNLKRAMSLLNIRK